MLPYFPTLPYSYADVLSRFLDYARRTAPVVPGVLLLLHGMWWPLLRRRSGLVRYGALQLWRMCVMLPAVPLDPEPERSSIGSALKRARSRRRHVPSSNVDVHSGRLSRHGSAQELLAATASAAKAETEVTTASLTSLHAIQLWRTLGKNVVTKGVCMGVMNLMTAPPTNRMSQGDSSTSMKVWHIIPPLYRVHEVIADKAS